MPTKTESLRSSGGRAAIAVTLVVLLIIAVVVVQRGRTRAGWPFFGRQRGNPAAGEGAPGGTGSAGADATMPPLAANRARPETGTGEAYLDHAYRAFIEAQPGRMGLTPAQANELVNDLLEFQEVKSEVIARFLRETSVEGSAVTVQVPAFPVEGKDLHDLLYRRLRTDFPDEAERIASEIGGYVDETFEGFGLAEQSYVIQPGRLPGTFEVTWSARVPEGAPPLREPDGATYGGGSGVLLLSRDQIENGELRFLTPVLARHFPASAK